MGKKLIIVGPAHPYRGGIAAFSERMAEEFLKMGHSVSLLTFTLQYPGLLFPGKTQYSESPCPQGLSITRLISSINPFTWIKAARWIRKQQPDMVIFSYWTPFMAPAMRAIAGGCKGARRIGLLHNLLPHEKHFYSTALARLFCSGMDSFACLSAAVKKDLESICSKPCTLGVHPLYDNFGEAESKEDACRAIGLDPAQNYILFFGLIRDYKGLDLLLEAYAGSSRRAKLVVAGEFYSPQEKYHALASGLGIDAQVIWRPDFIADSLVRHYFCAADLVVQPYRSATQSGITQIAYHFCKPMLVTDVGGLAEIVPHGVCGYVVQPEAAAIREALEEYWDKRPDFTQGILEHKKKYSWAELCAGILE